MLCRHSQQLGPNKYDFGIPVVDPLVSKFSLFIFYKNKKFLSYLDNNF
jgi:hypothetical protein